MRFQFGKILPALIMLAAPMAAQRHYNMTDLGLFPGGTVSQSMNINDLGQVVGFANGTGLVHGFLWQNGVFTDLGTLPGDTISQATAINNRGQIVVLSTKLANPQVVNGFTWDRGRVEVLPILGGIFTVPTGINIRGQAVGISNGRAVLWDKRDVTDLGSAAGCPSSAAAAINDHGEIAVTSCDHVLIWDRGKIRDLGTWTGIFVTHMNDRDDMVGAYNQHAFLLSNGVLRDLGTLPGGNWSEARSINDSGQIAGNSTVADGSTHAFIWENGVMTDLGTLGGINSHAMGINSTGQIAGFLQDHGGLVHAILLTPGK